MNSSLVKSTLSIQGLLFVVCCTCWSACLFWRKPPADRPQLVNSTLDERLEWLLRYDVPLIAVDSLAKLPAPVIFDVRKASEFAVSHIANAIRLEPGAALPLWTDTLSRNQRIAVYCSVGYRSEATGRRFQNAGFTNVSNLYGSLFEWVDRGYPVVDSSGNTTNRLHTYNQRWGELVTNPTVLKVW